MTCSACSMQLKGCSILSAEVLKSGTYSTKKTEAYEILVPTKDLCIIVHMYICMYM